jgi:NADPH:quinone reductase-like Zn-dependent oxidoreductase
VASRILIVRSGGPEVLRLEEFEPAPPAAGEIGIDVRAAGLNFADLFCRLGLYRAAPPPPFCPGFEVAGQVAAVGDGVQGFTMGQRVLAGTRFGGYTTYINVPARWARPLPADWSFAEGAAFSTVFLTAYHGLVQVGRLRAGETVVVQSAAGGVGTAACQLAKALGARVIGTVGSEPKRAAALAAGAEQVVVDRDYRVWPAIRRLCPAGVDLIFDAVGGRGLRNGYDSLALSGRLVVYGFAELMPRGGRRNWPLLLWRRLRIPRFSPFDMTGANRTVAGFNLVYLHKKESVLQEALTQLEALAEAGKVRPVVGATFPFEEVAQAHILLQSRRSSGKVVLVR